MNAIPKKEYLIYIGIGIALLPILLLRDYTPSNELRYLSIADEALRNHTIFSFTNHGVPYADKPPLYLWIIMFCKWLTGAHRMWLLGLFSLLPAYGITRLMHQWSRQEMNNQLQGIAQLTLLTSGLFIGTAVTLRMDLLMCYFIVLSLHTFWRMYQSDSIYTSDRLLFPLYLFLAVFTKGPLGLLIPLCSIIVYLIINHEIKQIFRYWGWQTWLFLLTGFMLWFGSVYIEGGSTYLHNLLFHQTIDRAVNAFHHEAPCYYYGISIWYSIAPWSLFIIGITTSVLCLRHTSLTPLTRFFYTIALTTFVLLSCISSKLQIYLLPAFPFLIYAAWLSISQLSSAPWLRFTLILPAGIFALTCPISIYLLHNGMYHEWEHPLLYGATALLTAGGIGALYYLLRYPGIQSYSHAIRCMSLGLLTALFAGGWALPHFNPYIGFGELCTTATQYAHQLQLRYICSWRISRPENMDVYLNKDVRILSNDTLPTQQSYPYLLLTRQRELGSFHGFPSQCIGSYAVIVIPPIQHSDLSISQQNYNIK